MIKKVFLLSILFFVLEILYLLKVTQNIDYTTIDDILLNFRGDQKRVVECIKTIQKNNRADKKATYIFGGSTAKQAFPIYQEWDDYNISDTYNFGISSQRLIDTIRVVDQIDVQRSNIIYVAHPTSFMIRDKSQLVYSKYAGGIALRYPVQSSYADEIFNEMDIDTENIRLKLMPSLNVHLYMLRNFIYKKFLDLKNMDFDKLLVDNSKSVTHHKEISGTEYNVLKKQVDETIKKYEKKYMSNFELNFYLLEKMIKLSKLKKMNLVVLDLPMSDVVYSSFTATMQLEEYYKRLNELAEKYKISYVKFNYDNYANNQKYFNDPVHLNYMGRDYFHDYLFGVFNALR